MTYAPATLSALARFWIDQNGSMLGIVGNKAHTKGYHLGKSRIFDGSGPGLGWDDYSVQLARDKAGLSDAASAIDLGRLGGTLANLRAFSRWLVAECLADPIRYRDIREVIYAPDAVYVKRYSAPDGKVYTSLRRNPDGTTTVVTPGNGDASHFTHTHISWYRDSVARDKVPLFAPYFAPEPPDTSTGDAMPVALNGTDRKFASTHARDIKAGTAIWKSPTERLTTAPRDFVADDYGYPVDTPGWAAIGATSAGYDADSEGENGIALVKTGDAGVGPVRRKTQAELEATARRFAVPNYDDAVNAAEKLAADAVRDAVVNAANKAAAVYGA